ncbi:MAG: tRNA-specific 2-thiouridylase [Rikenellaceae bacterium]
MGHRKVILGYSGGVDSTAAVALLQKQGFSVVALTLDMCGDDLLVEGARNAASLAGIEFSVVNCEKLFRQEIKDYFISEYVKGRTPAPCTRCNPMIKWRLLLEYATANNIYHIATGHYFRIEKYNGKLYVARAADSRKDQSYYLWGLSQEILNRAITPMADVIKEHINSEKRKESMGVCFLRGVRYGDYIRALRDDRITAGDIITVDGKVVAQHKGLAYYTVGQKRGEGIPSGSVVVGVDAMYNRLIIGEDKDLYHSYLYVRECNIVDEEELLTSNDISVMVRGIGRNPDGYATSVEPITDGFKVRLSSPAWACAAGQPVVFYRGDRVIGGGYLDYSRV